MSRRRYDPQDDKKAAERRIELALNYHLYETSYPTEEQIKVLQEKRESGNTGSDTNAVLDTLLNIQECKKDRQGE